MNAMHYALLLCVPLAGFLLLLGIAADAHAPVSLPRKPESEHDH